MVYVIKIIVTVWKKIINAQLTVIAILINVKIYKINTKK